MAFLNADERNALLQELKGMTFNRAKFKLHRMDPKGRLAFFRNAQHSGQLETRFELNGLGTRVTLIEHHDRVKANNGDHYNSQYELVDVRVEPTPENRL